MPKMAYQDAPKENLQTWNGLTAMLTYGAGAIAVFLLLLAWFTT